MSLSTLNSKTVKAIEEDSETREMFFERIQNLIGMADLNTAKLVLTIFLAALISDKRTADLYLDTMGLPRRPSLLLLNSCVFRKISTSCKLISSSQ